MTEKTNFGFNGPVSGFLQRGVENGLTSNDLQRLTGWAPRKINRIVDAERKNGAPILSDTCHGYFLPASQGEARLFVERMLHRSSEIKENALAVGKACRLWN